MTRLKVQLHIHSKKDPRDDIKQTEEEIISFASKNNYDVLAISCHNAVIFDDNLKKFAEEKNILLIPAIEKKIEKKHVLILNVNKDIEDIKTFKELEKYKEENKDILIIAPHPYYPSDSSLNSKLEENIKLFDAIEYNWFHTKLINKYNKKAITVAQKHNLPVVGTSDNHILKYFDHCYSIVNAEKNTKSVLNAIKQNQIEIVSKGVKSWQLPSIFTQTIIKGQIKYLKYKINQIQLNKNNIINEYTYKN